MNRTTGRKRLLELARFLRDEVTNKLFDFGEVFVIGEKLPKDALKAGGGCGTVGCGMGWADVRWPNQGLIRSTCHSNRSFYADDDNVAEFFGIDEDEVHFLFYPGALPSSATRLQLAKHIEKFVAEDIEKSELTAEILKKIEKLKKLGTSDFDEIAAALY